MQFDDLVNVSQTCHKLKTIAQSIFITVHEATINFKYVSNNFVKQQKILLHFGRLAKKIEVNHDSGAADILHGDGNKVLRSIGHSCGPNLKELVLVALEIRILPPLNVINLLTNLDKLKLIMVCTCAESGEIFGFMNSLTELFIHNSSSENYL